LVEDFQFPISLIFDAPLFRFFRISKVIVVVAKRFVPVAETDFVPRRGGAGGGEVFFVHDSNSRDATKLTTKVFRYLAVT
jgi:hypothetical protein